MLTITALMNPRSIAIEASTLTITPLMNPRSIAIEASMLTITPLMGQTKDYKIGICCFSAKHAALRRKSKDLLVLNQDNVSEWGNMFIRRLLFQ
jgi:hypothetical protein